MREIKFRALLIKHDKRPGFDLRWWEYYTTLHVPTWLDRQDVEIIIKDLQYTGLKDKNGKEIYEGDIVKEGKKKLEVFWNSLGSGQWWFLDKKCHVSKVSPGQLEVIGNIYENPELVKSDG